MHCDVQNAFFGCLTFLFDVLNRVLTTKISLLFIKKSILHICSNGVNKIFKVERVVTPFLLNKDTQVFSYISHG